MIKAFNPYFSKMQFKSEPLYRRCMHRLFGNNILSTNILTKHKNPDTNTNNYHVNELTVLGMNSQTFEIPLNATYWGEKEFRKYQRFSNVVLY